jgi:2-oxoisovalerate dehydrogenase E1 component
MTPEETEEHFVEAVRALRPGAREAVDGPVRTGSGLTVAEAREILDAQLTSRQLDLAARWMQQQGRGYYTIGSSGHEANAAVAAALRPTDPALLHYRSGAFYVRRAHQVEGIDPVRDVLLGVAASAEEPLAGGRHKVFGRAELSIVPLTSTIASHLPRAVGVAFAIARARKLGADSPWPADAIAVTSLGDASMNHSTAVGALNTACLTSYQGLPMPLLVVCEDNGLGISVRTPDGWVRTSYENRPGLRYFAADGSDPAETYDAARAAVDWVRTRRTPALLHLSVIRLLGHAGSDVEAGYRTPAEIAADLERDPLLGTARLLVGCGAMTREAVLDRHDCIREQVRAAAKEALDSRRLVSAEEVTAPLAPRSPERVAVAVRDLPEGPPEPLTLAQSVNRALGDLLDHHEEMLVFGEDVGRKGGVYGATRGLQRRFGSARVFDTPLDEQAVLGLGLGLGLSGMLPVAEIQYLAYLHNAADQLRGEASTLQFFSQGQYRNPLVVRIASYAYQRGFGGHFHNDNAVAALRDIPGLVVASPARPDDAAAMLRTCVEAARVDGSVCVYLEPIALYHERDLYDAGDDEWLAPYPSPSAHVPLGTGRTYGDGADLTLVTFGNGVRMSLRVARRLSTEGVQARVLDLRWLSPLPVEDLLREARATGRVLVVDETRHAGGVGEGVVTGLVENGYDGRIARVAAQDSFVPLGPAANLVLVQEADIERAARELIR